MTKIVNVSIGIKLRNISHIDYSRANKIESFVGVKYPGVNSPGKWYFIKRIPLLQAPDSVSIHCHRRDDRLVQYRGDLPHCSWRRPRSHEQLPRRSRLHPDGPEGSDPTDPQTWQAPSNKGVPAGSMLSPCYHHSYLSIKTTSGSSPTGSQTKSAM